MSGHVFDFADQPDEAGGIFRRQRPGAAQMPVVPALALGEGDGPQPVVKPKQAVADAEQGAVVVEGVPENVHGERGAFVHDGDPF